MPRIFDNIEQQLLPALQETLEVADHADFCVGYFNLRGWKQLGSYIEQWAGGEGHCCRLLIRMQRLPQEELHMVMSLAKRDGGMDNQTALRLKKRLAEEFRDQLTIGVPTNEDEAGLRRLAAQIKVKKVVVKLFLRHPLHLEKRHHCRPSLQKIIPELPPVVYSTRAHQATDKEPEGVLIYVRTAEGNDALAWVDKDGRSVTESQFAILKAAECSPDTPALPRLEKHHELVQKGAELIIEEEKSIGGQLGRPSGARFRTYERLKRYAEQVKGTLFDSQELQKAIEEIYRYPLRQSAIDTLNRQLRSGISDETLTQLVIALRDEDRLCLIHEEEQTQEPRIICSMGLASSEEAK